MLKENYREPMLPFIIDYSKDDWKIEVKNDSFSDNPRNWDKMGEFCVSNHSRYLDNESGIEIESESDFKSLEKTHIILPISIYDHSGVSIYVGSPCDRWDSWQDGWYIANKEEIKKRFNVKRISPKLRKRVESYLESEVETYNKWVNGEVYSFILYHNGEEEDSCGGFYDIDDIYEYLPNEYTSTFTIDEMKNKHIEWA